MSGDYMTNELVELKLTYPTSPYTFYVANVFRRQDTFNRWKDSTRHDLLSGKDSLPTWIETISEPSKHPRSLLPDGGRSGVLDMTVSLFRAELEPKCTPKDRKKAQCPA